ncbi:MAG: hypothetical protein KIH64_007135 [Mycobacterium sp.]|nr:hypothetical protein [Mycobacterium sp.]
MTTARAIITDSLKFGLNRLSPGETLSADTAADCLLALNAIADAINGGKALLFREILTASGSGISAATASLGTAWATLSPGDEILGVTYNDGSQDIPLRPLTMQQYHERIAEKAIADAPSYWADDGLATLYFYPVPTGQTITLRTKAAVTEFADLDTDYTLPKGWRSALGDMLTERLAQTMNPGVLPEAKRKAAVARARLATQSIDPAILSGNRDRCSILVDG